MQTQESWFCLYNSWLSVDRGVGNLMADIPAMKEHVYAGKRNLQFFSRANNDMRNEHLWFGVIAKTSYNRFTRVQRLLTGLTMLQCLMIFNLIFFETIDPDDAEQFIQVFEQKIHLTSIIIGIETSIIMSIIGFLLVIMFNKIAPKPHKNKNDELTEEEKEMFQTKMEREKYVAENRVVLDLPVHSPKQSSEESAEVASDWAESEEVDESDNATNRNFNAGSSSVDDELEISEALLKQRLAETVVNVPSDQDKDTSPENAKTFMLPWWFLIIAWVILGSFNLFLAYYIMLYGLSFGYELSVDWALAFFSGFFTNVFIVQPVKVILIVFVFVLIFKQTYTLKEKAPLAKLNEGLHLVNQKNFINEKYGSPSTKAIYQVPLNVAEAEQILKRLKIEHDAKEMLRDLVLYLVFMVCILSVVHGHLDVYLRYRQIKFTKEVYLGVREPLHSWDAGESLLADVREVEDMWDYIIDYLILPLVADDHEKMSPDSSYLIGPARLRQARVEPDTSGCLGIPENIRDIYGLEFCSLSMKNGVEEKRSFEGTWENPSNLTKVDMEDSPYVYRTAEELKTASFRGYFSKYTGGGYVAILSRKDYKSCKTSLEKLRRKDWIDQHTRCVFVEFTLYNPSSDLFTHVVIAFEFDVTGGLFPHYHVNSARFYLGEKRKERWLVLAEGVTFVCLLFYTAIQFNALYMSGFYCYIKNYWNIIEVIVLLLSYVAVCLYYLRLIAFTDALDLLNKFGHAYFIDFHTVFYRNFDFHVVMGFLAAFVIVKLVKVVTFNPFLIIFLRTMEVITPGIFGYSIISLLLLIALAALGNLLFGSKVIGYMTIGRSFYSLLFFILGEANYVYMSTLVDVLWPFYFLMVMFITQYLVLNFFIAILREGLERTKLQEFTEESETVKYMIQSIVRLLGLSRKNRRKL
ncbi:polycystin-1-like protein 2 isoform X2 [Physella acuta]|nr:polycystin-1-like protein 2 isoform X2 [Physella acuta]